ncbi:hypothetical protein [Synergistes jonesii]|uniref:hypothetical protein n=1 Tax=Synergistes jonesii TaxID=2754 RepID=UPI002A766968|nr:hypothetical protein [Synergistes jonesii]MDY2985076.1 hypothetical protein [Synergistes jonesii]
MERKYIRWLFLIAFAAFAVLMKHLRMMNMYTSLFIILWLLASYATVFGVVYFRDKNVVVEADSISAEELRIGVGLE